MPARQFTNGNSYRFGFNGKENDNEVKGNGDQQDYGMRVYDPRSGRFLSVDPIFKKYPWYSPYHFAGNTPIWAIDLDGTEPKHATMQKTSYAPVTGVGAAGFTNALGNVGTFVGNVASSLYNIVPNTANTLEEENGLDNALWNMQSSLEEGAKKYPNVFKNPKGFIQRTKEGLLNPHNWEDAVAMTLLTEMGSELTRTGPISFAENMVASTERYSTAASFYAESGFTAESALSHMEGIDFSKAVDVTTLKKGTIVQQWVGENGVGNYFTPVENGSAENLGLSDYSKRTLKQFKLTEDVKVLKSTAANYKGNAGGALNFSVPN